MATILFIVILVVPFSTCKKISKYPINMYGLWVTNDGYCDHMYIDIKKNGYGVYAPASGNKGCDGKSWKGKTRFTKTHLYIGYTGFQFLKAPSVYTTNDSIEWMYTHKYRILATMSVRLSFLHHSDIYTFKKIIDY